MNTTFTRAYRASDQPRFKPDDFAKHAVKSPLVNADVIPRSELERGNWLGSLSAQTYADRHGYPSA